MKKDAMVLLENSISHTCDLRGLRHAGLLEHHS